MVNCHLQRRKGDSNPRYGSPYSGFQDRRFQPLTHSSAVENTTYEAGISRYWMVRSFLRPGFLVARFTGAATGSGCLMGTVPNSLFPLISTTSLRPHSPWRSPLFLRVT